MKYYYIKRISIWRARDGYRVEVYSPHRGRKFRRYKKLSEWRILQVCRLIERLAKSRTGDLEIRPGKRIMSVELNLR